MQPFTRVEKAAAILFALMGAAGAIGASFWVGRPPTRTSVEEPIEGPVKVRPNPGEGVTRPPDREGPIGEIRLRVVAEDERPVAGAQVKLFDVAGAPAPLGEGGKTGHDGLFRSGPIPAERTYAMVVSAAGFSSGTSATFVLPAGKTYNGDVILKKGTEAVLEVVRGATPVPGARVVLKRSAAGSAPGVNVTLPVGDYIADRLGRVTAVLDPGRYAVQAGDPGPPWTNLNFEHPGPATVKVALE